MAETTEPTAAPDACICPAEWWAGGEGVDLPGCPRHRCDLCRNDPARCRETSPSGWEEAREPFPGDIHPTTEPYAYQQPVTGYASSTAAPRLTRVEIDLNVRTGPGQTRVGHEDADGPLLPGQTVEVYELESGLTGTGVVAAVHDAGCLAWINLDWTQLRTPGRTETGPTIAMAQVGVVVREDSAGGTPTPAGPDPAGDGMRERYAAAIREWHGDWTKDTFAQAADAVLAVRDGEMERLEADARWLRQTVQTNIERVCAVALERDANGREADRLRRDWEAMRTRAETAEAELSGLEETAADRYQNMLHWRERAEEAERAMAAVLEYAERQGKRGHLVSSVSVADAIRRVAGNGRSGLAHDLDVARATNQRLNYRAQTAESRLNTVTVAVADWQISERGTYVPLRTLNAIAKAVGIEHDTSRWELHYQRVEALEAERDAALGMADADSRQLAEVDERCDTAVARIAQALAVAEVIDANGIGWAADSIRRALTGPVDQGGSAS